jgi:hypothetical protein
MLDLKKSAWTLDFFSINKKPAKVFVRWIALKVSFWMEDLSQERRNQYFLPGIGANEGAKRSF